MPTRPAIDYIPTDDALLRTLGRFAFLIEETVNFGTHVLQWELESSAQTNENVPISLSMRHVLELLDSVAINVRNSCVDPCKLLLRGVLESFFAIAFILENDRQRRSLAFMAAYANESLRSYKRYDPTTEQGAQFRQLLEKDPALAAVAASIPCEVVKNAIINLEQLLKQPEYREVSSEYARMKKRGSRSPYWYSLFGGPNNLEKLADHLRFNELYHVLYRQWSSATHGMDIIRGKIAPRGEGQAAILQHRLPGDAQVLTVIAVSIGLKLFHLVIESDSPNRMTEYHKWYMKEIRTDYLRLTEGNIIRVEL
jgi:hypothetical protein